jgi:hypothetical protein
MAFSLQIIKRQAQSRAVQPAFDLVASGGGLRYRRQKASEADSSSPAPVTSGTVEEPRQAAIIRA